MGSGDSRADPSRGSRRDEADYRGRGGRGGGGAVAVKARVAYTEAAQEERREAVAFYRAASLDIARSFQREFKHEIALLKERPWIGAPYEAGTRRKVFPYFPY